MKNAITVIDQELIDWFENWLSDTEVNELLEIDEKTIELLDLAKDLIEINAELTKREQKYKSVLKVFAEERNIKYTPFGKVVSDLLKGE
jgi:hypothetical protein